ncbi:hypothetical protein ACA910_015114 [Epithemia clementina (nom. ined.)]
MSNEHAFQFHCMVCYDEFENSGSQYPVVLPCGHTYVCKRCADKLDKCMECREPLYATFIAETTTSPTPAAPSTVSRASWSSARSGSSAQYSARGQQVRPPGTREPKPAKKRLPLPKNVVLLSLIDATQLISGDAQSMLNIGEGDDSLEVSPGKTSSVAASKLSSAEDEEDENQRANFATSVSAGIAGTYAVAVQEGLQIFPTRPSSLTRSSSSVTDDDVDTLVQFFHTDKMTKDLIHNHSSGDSVEGSTCSHDPEMATLAYGDRIQVVSVERGWAKLARGYGFVRADKNQIMKVMNALDRACILEAMLRTLSAERRRLRIQQSENDTQFIRLMNQLQVSLQNDEDFTVVCRTAFDANEDSIEVQTGEDSPTEKKEGEQSTWDFSSEESRKSLFKNTLTPIEPNLPSCNAGFFGASRIPSPSPNVIRAGAQAWRERQAREVQKSINFRSGMSGHMALASSRAHPHDFLGGVSSGGIGTSGEKRKINPKLALSSVGPKVTNFRMSTHSGLTLAHRKKPTSSSRSKKNIDSIKLTESM